MSLEVVVQLERKKSIVVEVVVVQFEFEVVYASVGHLILVVSAPLSCPV